MGIRIARKRRGGVLATPATTALDRIAGWATNLDWISSERYTKPFTDHIKSCSGFAVMESDYATFNSTWTSSSPSGWPQNINNSCVVRIFLATFFRGDGYSYFVPGVYKARLAASLVSAGWTCQFVNENGSSFVSVSGAGATATCTISSSANYDGLALRLRCNAPSSGGPHSFAAGVEVYLQSNEAWLDSYHSDPTANYYKIFAPDFLADLAGVKMIRVKDWTGTDTAARADDLGSGHFDRRKDGPCQYSDLTLESHFTWQMQDMARTGHVPFSVCAKLARYLNCGLYVAFPLMHNRTSVDCATDGTITAYNHTYANGDVVTAGGSFSDNGTRYVFTYLPFELTIFTRYYVRDVVAGVSFKISATPGGAAITFASATTNAATYDSNFYKVYSDSEVNTFFTAIANDLYTNAPNIDIIPDLGNENWNAPQPYGLDQCWKMWSLKAGVFNWGSGYAYAQQRVWAAVEAYYPRSQVIRIIQGQHAFFDGMALDAYNYIDATLNPGVKTANLLDAHCCDFYIYGNFFPAAYNNQDNNNQATFASNWLPVGGTNYYISQPYYHTGDTVHMTDGNEYHWTGPDVNVAPPAAGWVLDTTSSITGAGLSWSDTQMESFAKISNSSSAYYLGLYKAAGDALRTVSPPLGFISYEGSISNWGNAATGFAYTNAKNFAIKYGAWQNTTNARTALQDCITKHNAVGMRTFCYYVFAGIQEAVSDTDAVFYSFKRSFSEADTFASAYFKTVTTLP